MGGGRIFRTGLGSAAALAMMGVGLSPVAAAATGTATTSTASTVTTVSTSTVASVGARRGADRDLLRAVSSTRWFSPNGDRVRDKVRVGIQLERRADVSLTVRRLGRDKVLRRVSLGDRRAGNLVWAWDGRNDRGRVVRDGSYRVDVVAKRDRGPVRRDRAVTRVVLRTSYTPITSYGGEPRLELSRTTVHPTTRDFADAVQIWAFQRLEKRTPWGSGGSGPISPAMEIRDASGKVVQEWRRTRDYGALDRAWTGTTAAGAPLPAGTYRLVVRFRDNYGNTGRSTRRLHVSAAPLVVQSTWSDTLTAAEALTSPPDWYTSCDRDCTPTCSPGPSSRTAGALTLRSPTALRLSGRSCPHSEGTFAAPVPFTLGATDLVTVTLNGSEHPSGTTGTARLTLLSAWGWVMADTTPGTLRTTLGPTFFGSRGKGEPVTDRVRWSANGGMLGETDHDLETFEVQVVRYAPAG